MAQFGSAPHWGCGGRRFKSCQSDNKMNALSELPARQRFFVIPVGSQGMTDTLDTLPPCPVCGSENTYELDPLLVCPECAHEWDPTASDETASDAADSPSAIVDAVGNELSDGDDVTVVKTVKVKGAQQPIKSGTKVRNIRLIDTTDDHNIDCKIEGFGAMKLKSSIVRKA